MLMKNALANYSKNKR